jgi:hypothetical protein
VGPYRGKLAQTIEFDEFFIDDRGPDALLERRSPAVTLAMEWRLAASAGRFWGAF